MGSRLLVKLTDITGSSSNTDEVQPPKITTSPGRDVQQAVCHIRVIGELINKTSMLRKICRQEP